MAQQEVTCAVLVCGGGFAGAKLAVELAVKGVDVLLVSSVDFFEVSFANARALVEPELADLTLWSYSDMRPHGRFLHGTVKELGEHNATLEDGTTVQFAFAAVATGSSYSVGKATAGVVSLAARRAELQALSARVRAASRVLIVGGGPLGVELAGEVLTDIPGAAVTLVHSGPRLLPAQPAGVGAAAEAWLRAKGCQLLLNDRLDLSSDEHLQKGFCFQGSTKHGVALNADVVLQATGLTPNTGLLATSLQDALDSAGRIKVDRQLRILGHPTLFALGDVTDLPEQKLAFLASAHAEVAAANIVACLRAAPNGAGADRLPARMLRSWKPSMGLPVMLVTLGRRYAVGHIGCLILRGWLPTRIKASDLRGFVRKYRGQLLAAP